MFIELLFLWDHFIRIKLNLRPIEKNTVVPINYQYPLSAAIYKILSGGSTEYSQWLHNNGYLSPTHKPLKLFVFSKLFVARKNRSIQNNSMKIYNFPMCSLYISSPMLEDFIQNFVVGLFSDQKIEIGGKHSVGRFNIEQVETIPIPDFNETQLFTCMSPMTISTAKEDPNDHYEHYIRPSEDNFSEALRKNLIAKYRTIHKKEPSNDNLEFKIDAEYFHRKGGDEGISKLITIKEGAPEETQVKAFETPFSLTGSKELKTVAYECGIGQRNSMGFGMVEVV